MVEICGAITVSAYSLTWEAGSVVEFNDTCRMGLSAGFSLRVVGGFGIPGGSRRATDEIEFCTSAAAESISRSSENCKVRKVCERWLDDVMLSSPAIVENSRSSGAATDDAMVSGLAPGRFAMTMMVGKSITGRSFTGSAR